MQSKPKSQLHQYISNPAPSTTPPNHTIHSYSGYQLVQSSIPVIPKKGVHNTEVIPQNWLLQKFSSTKNVGAT